MFLAHASASMIPIFGSKKGRHYAWEQKFATASTMLGNKSSPLPAAGRYLAWSLPRWHQGLPQCPSAWVECSGRSLQGGRSKEVGR